MLLRRLPLALLFLLAACKSGGAPQPPPPAPVATATVATAAPAAPQDDRARIQVFALSDFHGHLAALEPPKVGKYYGGLANIAGQLAHKERLDPARALILDNGDMWTGQTESTFLRGEPVIAAYNAMGVAAVNIANHEFDFGQEILRARASEAKFPFLGANLVKTGSSEHPSFVKPWIVVERDGIKVGIIGLSYVDTPRTTLPTQVQGLAFLPYAETLKAAVPKIREEGAEVLVLMLHDTVDVGEALLKSMPELGLALVVAGQNHRKGVVLAGQTPIVNPGPFGQSYARFDLEVDRKTRALLAVKHEIVDVQGTVGAAAYPPSAEVAAVVEAARQKSTSMSGELLGRLAKPMPKGSFQDSPLGHFVVDAWLANFPDVDLAICNHGALRQPLASGPVSLGDLLGVMPFENNLYIVKITGKQLKEQLTIDSPVVGGITWSYREKGDKRTVTAVVDRRGKPLDDGKKYSVLINDFMYLGGDGFRFKELDAAPEDTGLSWRQPVIRALRMAEAAARPIEPPTTARAGRVR